MSARPLVALIGNPNAGKTSLFNALTGARQKVGNYPGVTVERHAGHLHLPHLGEVDLVDLPGSYSLTPASPDEEVARNVLLGTQAGEKRPDALIIVVDAGNLAQHLRFVFELRALAIPTIVALNMVDMAERDGLRLNPAALEAAINLPVIATVAVRRRGVEEIKAKLDELLAADAPAWAGFADMSLDERTISARCAAKKAVVHESVTRDVTRRIDAVLLHPIAGFLILLAILFVIFQSVFSLAEAPIGWIEAAIAALGDGVKAALAPSILRDLLTEGVIAGVGAVVAFLPQIVILFFFILLLEATGYMARAAFLMDGLMARLGLSGRGFIPLLSSFACAVPGIMATRAIADPKDRLVTILIAPLMTCSARLPVYAVIISAFIPARQVAPAIGLQGLVLFGLYLMGILGAMGAAFCLRRTVARGGTSHLLMEMPRYQWPRTRDILIALLQRAWIFLRRAGTIIFTTTVILWVLLSFPRVGPGSAESQIEHSIGGRIASGIEYVVRPIGFNHDIAIALLPAMAAREVAVSALATAYAIDTPDEAQMSGQLASHLGTRWSLATALAFLVWFVFAPQCISTIAITRRETNSWKWPAFMVGYLFVLAYVAAGATYWTAVAFGLG